MNFALLDQMVLDKFVNIQKHPTFDLYIYNYTQKTQFQSNWNEVTLACRGLILDNQKNIIARPLKKFFNLEELEFQTPEGDYTIYEKLDGSLGVLYFYQDAWHIATRGSFSSEQAIYATKYLLPLYLEYFKNFDRNFTYLFEIIYPQNRIVVDYHQEKKLVLLAVINTESGDEKDINEINFPNKAKIYNSFDKLEKPEKLSEKNPDNEEGYVLKYANNHRIKVKFSTYKRLHNIITNVNKQTIWEYLKDGKDFDELLDRVPDEFYNWLKKTKAELENSFNDKYDTIMSNFEKLDKTADRKDQAIFITTNFKTDSLYYFGLLDGRDITESIWKNLKPEYEKPFEAE
jgi:T4 RnlA family RNA ligase